MLQKLKIRQQDKKGFTIIEVMIVLAIAGLIMLIVFLAVPSLQRSARNTQRKNDAAAIASAVANYLDNNGGTEPAGAAIDANDANAVDFCQNGGAKDAVASGACTAGDNFESAKLGYYTPGSVYLDTAGEAVTPGSTASKTVVSQQTVIVDEGFTCDANNNGLGTPNSRSAAILFVSESSGSGAGSLQCLEQ